MASTFQNWSYPQPAPFTPPRLKKEILAAAIQHHQAGHLAEADRLYRQILATDPEHHESLHLLGVIAIQTGQFEAAIGFIDRAIQIYRHHPLYHGNFATALKARGRVSEAIAHYKRAIILKPDYADAYSNLANVLAEQGHYEDALVHYRKAIAINPNHSEAHNNLGNSLKEQGLFQKAMAHYDRALAIRPGYTEAHYNRSELKKFRPGDPDLALLESLAAQSPLPDGQALYLHFALGKALDDCEQYDRAFEHWRIGNHIKRRQIHYDETSSLMRIARTAEVFTRDLLERFRGQGDPSEIPIFIVGMPRSGSTLVEQILAAHPHVHAAGELDALVQAAAAMRDPSLDQAALHRTAQSYLARIPDLPQNKTRIVDKLPANFLHIGLIHCILPNAKIIHTMRNPADTSLSCYSKLFATSQNFTYDLAELGRYYRAYDTLMSHWRDVLPAGAMLDVSYEDVLDDLEGQARRIVEYCCLPWHSGCASFHSAQRPIKTASAVQVRQPLYRSSLQRWRRYESGLRPLLEELAAC